MSRHLLHLLLLTLLLPRPAAAQAIEAGVFSLPSLDATARGAALGGAPAVANGPDAAAFLYNPALLSEVDDGRLAFGYLNHLSSLRVGSLAYARSVPRIGTMAVGLRFLGWGAIPRTDETGTANGDFRAGELALSVAASRAYGSRIRYGATLHWLRSAIDGRAAGAFAADAGVVALWPERRFAITVSAHRIGFVMGSIGSGDHDLGPDVRVGLSKRLEYLPVLLSVTSYGFLGGDLGDDVSSFLDRAFRHLLVGAEFQFSEAFQVRFGYDHRRHAALKTRTRLDVAGLSLGTGIRIRRVAVDYAWTSWSSLGGLHRFTVTTSI